MTSEGAGRRVWVLGGRVRNNDRLAPTLSPFFVTFFVGSDFASARSFLFVRDIGRLQYSNLD
jgi:hypothetical protein